MLVLMFTVTACNSSSAEPLEAERDDEPPTQIEPIDVYMNVEVDYDRVGMAHFEIETNLPDGTSLSVHLSQVGGFKDNMSANVNNGKAKAVFGDTKGPLKGSFELTVYMFSVHQPTDVKAIIGNHGSNLIGDLVKADSITNSNRVVFKLDYEF